MSTTLRAPDAFWQHAATKQFSTKLTQFPSDQRFVVACSGGRDSLFLLYALVQLVGATRVCAVTVNHQLHADAAQWCEHVHTYCKAWGVQCVIKTVDVAQGNIEQQARLARYHAFFDVTTQLKYKAVLVLAHHLQDQAETLLMRLFRGSGLRGLGGMREHDVRFGMTIWRPLLGISWQYINDMTVLCGLKWAEDDANHDAQYQRVFLRQHIIPALNERTPHWMEAAGRTALLLQDAQMVVDEVVTRDTEQCRANENTLDIDALHALPLPRQRLLIAHWLQGAHHYSPAFEIVEQVLQLSHSRVDAHAQVCWHEWQVRRHAQQLCRLPLKWSKAEAFSQLLALGDTIELPSGMWRIVLAENGFDLALLTEPILFCPRQGGERMQLAENQPRRALKKTIQEAGLALWQREQLHVIFAGEQLLCVLTETQIWYEISQRQTSQGWLIISA